jgi:drug/metabolite transporter (DMT)-like permease
VLSLAYFLRMAIKRKKWLPFGFQAFGILLVAPNPYWLNSPVVLWVGVSAIFIGSLLYAMPGRWLDRIEESVLPFAARKMQSSPGEGR